ncbi:unnamed protein product [Vitrella brassicaformis CCMP3155]|uniref:Uncharacterized protein n=1 Tax=Vitrella brassicaformis (strain CCMP3155) TaxID=1169540 RepID=A0A0G4EBJ1_VITBC|nr:unnamed protein product [Vitrella brassicaformis CCMP3155]|eukprot:CEL93340.1 unnamed protein product [Vitrella brassicaformis CCMP3155]
MFVCSSIRTVGGSQVAGPLYSGVNYFPDALFEWQLDYPNDPDPMEFAIRTNPASIINNVCVDLYLRKLQNEYPQSISDEDVRGWLAVGLTANWTIRPQELDA